MTEAKLVTLSAELVARARAGNRSAFESLFRRYARMVHGIALARLTASEADDVVQEVFFAALTQLETVRDVDALGGWLAQIARNRSIDVLRRRRSTSELNDDLPSHHKPDAVVEAEQILAKLQELPEAYRETLVLRLVEGLSGNEIAEKVGLTPESVRVNLHRGMTLLRQRL
jgi:RNA polymerase sigma-70 factor, ECF subfamily